MPSLARLAPLALLPLAGCLGPSAPSSSVTVTPYTITVNGALRTFVLVPGETTTVARPLVLVYHGAGGSAMEILTNTYLADESLARNYVLVSLDAIRGYGGRWATHPSDLSIADDLAFTRAVIDTIAKVVPIDRARLFAVGYSRGGDMVNQIACRAPELMRGVAAVAATTQFHIAPWCDSTATNSVQPSVTMVLGSEDPLMPWDGGVETRMSAPQSLEFWRARAGCPEEAPTESPVPARPPYTVTRMGWESCSRGELELYKVTPLDHRWPAAAFFAEAAIFTTFSLLPRR